MKATESTRFDQAQRQLDHEMASSAPTDMSGSRTFVRHTARGQLRLLPGSVDDDPRSFRIAMLRDMSRGGIGVLTTEPLRRGTMFQVQFESAAAPLGTVAAVSRHSREVIGGIHLVGLAFGVDAALLVSQGVSPGAIVLGDGREDEVSGPGEFVDPKVLIDGEAA